MTSLSRAQRHRLELHGKFPARMRIGHSTVVWSKREIEEWMETRPRARYVPRGALLGPQRSNEKDESLNRNRASRGRFARRDEPAELKQTITK